MWYAVEPDAQLRKLYFRLPATVLCHRGYLLQSRAPDKVVDLQINMPGWDWAENPGL